MIMDEDNKKARITLTITEEVAKKIEQAANSYGIPKTSYIILATLEKIKKEELGKNENVKESKEEK